MRFAGKFPPFRAALGIWVNGAINIAAGLVLRVPTHAIVHAQ